MKKREIFNLSVVFIAVKIIVILAILYISHGPFGTKNHNNGWKWVSKEFSTAIELKNTLVIEASSPDKPQTVEVSLNDKKISVLSLDQNKHRYIIHLDGYDIQKKFDLKFKSNHEFKLDNDGRMVSWKVYGIFTEVSLGSLSENLLNNFNSKESGGIYNYEDNYLGKKDSIINGLFQWDSGWYINIIQNGYSFDGSTNQQNVAFYYTYPIICSIIYSVFHIDLKATMIIVNNLATFISIILMYKIAKDIGLKENRALAACSIFMINPFLIFLTAAYSEGTYLLISSITIMLMLRKRYYLSVVIGGLLSGTRSIGILFAIIFLFYYLYIEENRLSLKGLVRLIPMLIISVWGKLAFMIFNLIKFKNMFASEIVQKGWGNIGNDITLFDRIRNVRNYMLIPFKERFDLINPSVVSIMIVYFLILIMIFGFIRYRRDKKSIFLLFWSLVQIILPIVIFGTTGNNPVSMGRYVLPMFPLYIILVKLLEDKLTFYIPIILIFIFEAIIISIGFSQGLVIL